MVGRRVGEKRLSSRVTRFFAIMTKKGQIKAMLRQRARSEQQRRAERSTNDRPQPRVLAGHKALVADFLVLAPRELVLHPLVHAVADLKKSARVGGDLVRLGVAAVYSGAEDVQDIVENREELWQVAREAEGDVTRGGSTDSIGRA